MALITSTNFLVLADNVAKALVDLEAAYITNPITATPSEGSINTGLQTLQTHIANLGDLTQETALGPTAITDANNLTNWMNITSMQFYMMYREFMNALDLHLTPLGGVAAFLTSNNLQVHPEFANCFNYFASNAASLGLRNAVVQQIAPANVFVGSNQYLGSLNITGAAAGTYSPGTPIDTTKYAPQTLYLQNTGSGAIPSGVTLTITYTNASGSTVNLNWTTGSMAANAIVSMGVIGISVNNMAVTGNGTSGQQLSVLVQPLRIVTY